MERPGLFLRLLSAFVLATAWGLLYSPINQYGSKAPHTRVWVSPLERWPGLYVPELAFPYLIVGLIMPFAPLFYPGTRAGFLRALIALTLTGIGCLTVYLVYPVRMTRPAYDQGRLGESLMRWATSLDGPANCLPSSHAAFAVCAAALMTIPGKHALWFTGGVWALTVVILVSTVSVGQHYIRDSFAGAALGLSSVIVAIHLIPEVSSSS